MPADFQPLADELTDMTNVVDATVAFMDGVETRLNEAIAADNLSDNSNVAQFRDALAAQKTKLADAIVRNTSSEGEGGGETGSGTEG